MKTKKYCVIGILAIITGCLFLVFHNSRVSSRKEAVLFFIEDSGLQFNPVVSAKGNNLVIDALQIVADNRDAAKKLEASVWCDNADILLDSIIQLASNEYSFDDLLSLKNTSKENLNEKLNNLFLLSYITTHLSRRDQDREKLFLQGKAHYNIGIKLSKTDSYIVKAAGYACKYHGFMLLDEYSKRIKNSDLDSILHCLEWDLNRSKKQMDFELRYPLLSMLLQHPTSFLHPDVSEPNKISLNIE